MVNFMYCSHDSSRLWDPASFNFGDANALEIDASNDDEEYVLHPGPRPQHVSHQLIAPHTEGKSPPSNFVFIAEAQDTKRESLIRYTLDPGFIGPLRDDHGFSDRLKLPTAETLSESEPSAQSVHQEDKCVSLDQLESPAVTVHTGFTPAEETPVQTEFPSLSGPDDKEWDSKKEAIGMYYMKQNLPLTRVLGLMKTNHGFSATKPMYKTRFRKWKWKKYKTRQKKEKQAPTFSVEMPVNFTAAGLVQDYAAPLGDNLTTAPSSGVFEDQTMLVAAPLRFALVTEDSIFVKGIVDILRSHVRMVFYSEEDIQCRWKVTDPFEVEEDECDDLFVKVVNFSHQSLSYPSETWQSGVHRISVALDPVIQGCGLFALPTIWTCTFRLLKEGHPQAAFEFLLQARRLAVNHGWAEPFQRILELLTELLDATELFASQLVDTTPLQNGLKEAYLCCLEQANSSLRSSKLTLLSLRSFFINYIDKSCTSEQQRSLDEAKDLVEESKLMNGVNSQTTLNIMGQRLFILQSLSEPPPELETVAKEINAQIMLLPRRPQGPLDDQLLDIWKDAKHVLADYYSRKNDSIKAISLLQDYMAQCSLGGYGDFDEIAKKKLDDLLKQTPVVMEQAQHTVYCNQRDCFCLYRTVDWGSFSL